jgi:hypothetical protein
MVESINLWSGPSVCITADIIAVVGCQRAGLRTASFAVARGFCR